MSFFYKEAKNLIREIASDENMIDYAITTKQQNFTGDNYLGRITRVNLKDKNSKKNGHILNLILKSSPDESVPRDTVPLDIFYKREIYAYRNILPVLRRLQEINDLQEEDKFKYAKFYKGTVEEFKEMIILKDLSFEGYEMYDRKVSFDYEHAALAFKYLSRFHATSFVLKMKDPGLFKKFSGNVANSFNYGEAFLDFMKSSISQCAEVLPSPAMRSKVEKFGGIAKETLTRLLDASRTEPYNVICHGDSWINNMLFKSENGKLVDVVFVDWQIIRLASPITDLAYMTFVSTDKAFREKYFNQLLDVYYETLENNVRKMGYDLSSCYPRDVFEEQRKEIMLFGLVMGLNEIPYMLKKDGEEEPIEKLIEKVNDGNLQMNFNDIMIERLTGVVEDFCEMGYL